MNLTTKLIVLCVVVLATGCRERPAYLWGGDRVLVRAAGNELREQELAGAMPGGIVGKDSADFAELFLGKWVRKQLKLREAEELFSDSADDIEAMVEEYRQSLLIRKLDRYYVDSQVDTVFSEKEVQAYYDAHKGDFKLDRALVKGRMVRCPISYRRSGGIQKLLAASSSDKLRDLTDICAKNGLDLTEYPVWTDAAEFLANLPVRRAAAGSSRWLDPGVVQQLRDDDANYYFIVTDVVRAGQTAPLETRTATIRRILFNQRQAEVIRNHEEALFEAALEAGDVRFYE